MKETIGARAGHGWYPDDSLGTIIGIVEDFHFNSLHYKVNTLSMVVHPDWGYDEMSIKVERRNVAAAVLAVKELWEEYVPGYPFSYSGSTFCCTVQV